MDKWIGIEAPRWMKVSLIVCKWLICMLPFIITSIMFMIKPEMTMWDNWMLTCVYILSLSNVINCLDN